MARLVWKRESPILTFETRFMKPRRRFGVSDAIALIAATATAFAVTRADWPQYLEDFSPGGDAYRENFVNFAYRLRYLIYTFSYVVAAWSVSLLVLCLRRPRPGLRPFMRQPGMVAGVAAAVVLSIRMVNLGIMFGVYAASFHEIPDRQFFDEVLELTLIPSEIGCAVSSAWIVQALSGRWQAQPGWLDRTGRVIGCYWIGTIPLSWFSFNT